MWTWNWIWFTWQLQRCPRADILCLVIQWCLTLCDPMDYIAGQAPQNPWRFSRQEYWNGLPCPPPGDLPNPRIKLRSPTVWVDSLPSEPRGKPKNTGVGSLSLLQWVFPTQKLNQGFLHSRWIFYQLSYQGTPSPLSPLPADPSQN